MKRARRMFSWDRFRCLLAEEHAGAVSTRSAPDAILQMLVERGAKNLDVIDEEVSYREGVVEAGARIAVVGVACWEQDLESREAGFGYRDRPMRLRVTAPKGESLLLSNEPFALGS